MRTPKPLIAQLHCLHPQMFIKGIVVCKFFNSMSPKARFVGLIALFGLAGLTALTSLPLALAIVVCLIAVLYISFLCILSLFSTMVPR